MMSRKTSRRLTNYYKQDDEPRANEEQHGNNQQPQQQYLGDHANKPNDNDSLIADMAQGFIQAQANMTEKVINVNNQDISLLLQKINDQLKELKASTSNATPTSEQSDNNNSIAQDSIQQKVAGTNAPEKSQEQGDDGSSKKLQALLTTVLEGKNNNDNSASKSSNTKSNDTKQSNEEKSPQKMMAVQNVSQVLAQAQYELANELETSLKKLKQVISESEKLANNISNLLGEETMKKG